MKKQTKILTAVLVLALVFGVLGLVASAASNDMLSGANTEGTVENFFKDDITDIEFTSDIKGTSTHNVGKMPGFENGTAGRHGHIYSTISGDNTYLRFWHQNSWTPTYEGTSVYGEIENSPYMGMFVHTKARSLMDYKYAVYDFDISSDKYLDENGALDDPNDDVPASKKLAYKENAYFQYMFYKGDNGRGSLTSNLKLTSSGDDWYIGFGSNKAKLSGEAGVWNHITLVFEMKYTETETAGVYDFSDSVAYLYVDGEFITTDSTWSWGLSSISFNTETRFDFAQFRLHSKSQHTLDADGNVTATVPDFSIGIDNVGANYYKAGYQGELSGDTAYKSEGGVDSYFELGNAVQKLYELDDVIFNVDYKYSSPNVPIATVTVGDSVVEKFYFSEGANNSKHITDGCTLTVSAGQSLEDFNPAIFGIERGIVVVLEEGASLTLASGCPYTFNGTEIAKTAASNALPVIFYSDDTFETELDAIEIYEGQDIEIPLAVKNTVLPFAYLKSDSRGAIYRLHTGWNWNYVTADSDEDGIHAPMTSITPEMFAEMYQYNKGVGVFVYPVFEEKIFAFELRNDEGELIDKSGVTVANGADISVFADDANFVSVGSGAPRNSTVKLNRDILLSGEKEYISLRSKTPIFIDLNGYTLTRNGDVAEQGTLFSASNNSVLTIYSSRPGGTILHTGHFNGSIQAGSMINSWGNYGFDLTFGAYKNEALGIDADGDNLTIYSTAIVDTCAKNETESKITINGGKYYRTSKYANSLFRLASKVTFDARNAEFYSFESSAPIIHDEYGKIQIGVTATFDNCVILKPAGYTGGPGIVNSNWGANSSATFTNSTIIGYLPSAALGQLIFGENVKLSNQAKIGQNCVAADGYKIVETVGETQQTYNVIYYDVTYDNTTDPENPRAVIADAPSDHKVYYTVTMQTAKDSLESSALVNVTTKNGFFMNLYIPESFAAKVYSDPACTSEIVGAADANGIKYTAAAISPASVEKVTFYVKANGEGDAIEISVSLADYFAGVLAQEDTTELEKVLVLTAANYCKRTYAFVNGSETDAYDAMLTPDIIEMITVNNDALVEDAKAADIDAISSVISGATVAIGEGNIPVFAFKKVADGDVNVRMYSIDEGKEVSFAAVKSGELYLTSTEYGIYDMVTNLTVSVGELQGTYNLAAYIVSAEEGSAKELAMALYAYSLISREYVTTAE